MMFFFLPGLPDTTADASESSSAASQEGISRASDDTEANAGEGHRKMQDFDFGLVWTTIAQYRRWPHFLASFCVFSTWSPLTTYTPSIIM